MRILITLFITITTLSATLTDNGFRAKKILRETYEKVLEYNCYKVKFICTSKSRKENYFQQDTLTATFKGDKYIFDLGKQKVVSDGEKTWTILGKEIQEELAIENELTWCNPLKFLSSWDDFYTCILTKENKKDIWVSLVVKDISKAKVVAILFMFNAETENLKEVIITNKNGEATTLSILAIEKQQKIDDLEFKL